MKIETFLIWIQDKMLNYPDLDFKTLKIFIDKFHKCLSEKERIRWYLLVQTIKEFTSKQISLDVIVQNVIAENLSNELDKIQKNDNNDQANKIQT